MALEHRVIGDRVRCEKSFVGAVSRTKQSETDACDINKILSQYVRTGTIDHLAHGQESFADVYDLCDYRDALDIVRETQAVYDGLPEPVRKRCGSPEEFLAFACDPANADELRSLGLAKPVEEKKVDSVPSK